MVRGTATGQEFRHQRGSGGAGRQVPGAISCLQDLEEQKRTKYKINGTATAGCDLRLVRCRCTYSYSGEYSSTTPYS